jgi:DNA-binding HxlR family transcriptional regulator
LKKRHTSEEGIATNILASRLAQLEQKGILVKKPSETDKRKEVYSLTEKGLDLIHILLELASWGAQYDPQTGAPQEWIALVNAKQRGGSSFSGPDSVVKKFAEEK